jgi:predicted HNH restriction endonuclease
MSVQEIEFLLERNFPDEVIRNRIVRNFGEMVTYASKLYPNGWSVTWRKDQKRIKLIVQNIIIFSLCKNKINIAVRADMYDEPRLEIIDYIFKENNLLEIDARMQGDLFLNKKYIEEIKHSIIVSGKRNRGGMWKKKYCPQIVALLNRNYGFDIESPDYFLELVDEQIAKAYCGESSEHKESRKRVYVNKWERDRKARLRCIDHHGYSCAVCGFLAEEKYGDEYQGMIHVHHKVPHRKCGDNIIVDPVKDLIPLCPNCHAAIHYSDKCNSVEQLRNKIE